MAHAAMTPHDRERERERVEYEAHLERPHRHRHGQRRQDGPGDHQHEEKEILQEDADVELLSEREESRLDSGARMYVFG